MKVKELIKWLQTLEQDWEIVRRSELEPDGHDEISHINVNEATKTYCLN